MEKKSEIDSGRFHKLIFPFRNRLKAPRSEALDQWAVGDSVVAHFVPYLKASSDMVIM